MLDGEARRPDASSKLVVELTRLYPRVDVQADRIFVQRSGGQSPFSTPLRARAPQESVVRKVTDLLEAYPAAAHTVADLARHANVSVRHLTSQFREELDASPAEYLADIRFDLARCSLEAGASVAQTALDAGFSSAESLRRSFVARLGISPSQYQRRFRSAGSGAMRSAFQPVVTASPRRT